MFISARKSFSPQEPGWDSYKQFINFSIPDELYTIDSALNSYIDDCSSFVIDDLSQLESVMPLLPRVDPGTSQYYQLAINILKEERPPLDNSVTQLGHDICDATCTSSLLNCGPWLGELTAIASHINGYGLLSLPDAKLARDLLPQVWGESEPHAHVDIWLLCKLSL
jgi:hypothetical protein